MKVVLTRLVSDKHQTRGRIDVYIEDRHVWSCKTMELPWRNNQVNVSCIPVGKYPATWCWSPAFKENLFLIHPVPGRSGIRIHVGNYVEQLSGCIALGYNYRDIDHDGDVDVEMSRICLEAFHNLMTEKFELIII